MKKDALYLLHENGSISVYVRKANSANDTIFSNNKQTAIGEQLFNDVDSSFSYRMCVQSDPIRLTKSLQIFGFSVCPVTEKHFAILLNDGRILKYARFNKVWIQTS